MAALSRDSLKQEILTWPGWPHRSHPAGRGRPRDDPALADGREDGGGGNRVHEVRKLNQNVLKLKICLAYMLVRTYSFKISKYD